MKEPRARCRRDVATDPAARTTALLRAGDDNPAIADLWVLTHRGFGPIETFLTEEGAEVALAQVFGDEPTWVGTLSVEPFELVVADRYESHFRP